MKKVKQKKSNEDSLQISLKSKNMYGVIESYNQAHFKIHKDKTLYKNVSGVLDFARGTFCGINLERSKLFNDLIGNVFWAGIWFAKTNPDKVKIKINKKEKQNYIG